MRLGRQVTVMCALAGLVACAAEDLPASAYVDKAAVEGRYCTPDRGAEPTDYIYDSKTGNYLGYKRCGTSWEKKKATCLDASACSEVGLGCSNKAGAAPWDRYCLIPCSQESDCAGNDIDSKLDKCRACPDAPMPYCASSATCPAPWVESKDGYGKVCPGGKSPYPCAASNDCCSTSKGLKKRCMVLYSSGKPNPYSTPSCRTVCSSDAQCALKYGSSY